LAGSGFAGLLDQLGTQTVGGEGDVVLIPSELDDVAPDRVRAAAAAVDAPSTPPQSDALGLWLAPVVNGPSATTLGALDAPADGVVTPPGMTPGNTAAVTSIWAANAGDSAGVVTTGDLAHQVSTAVRPEALQPTSAPQADASTALAADPKGAHPHTQDAPLVRHGMQRPEVVQVVTPARELPFPTVAQPLAQDTSAPSKRSPEFEGPGLGAAQGALQRLGVSVAYEAAPTAGVVPESQVAEVVSAWVTQGVQQAELTIEGMAGEPVQVHIALEGDQAQVAFRSNQPELRHAIEAAAGQLKTLLREEGVQLMGLSVGAFASDATLAQHRAPRPAVARGQTIRVGAAERGTGHLEGMMLTPVPRGVLDLYV